MGYLGDCWLLSSIACLAEFPDAVYDLFITKEVTEDGMYTLKLFDPEAGKWAEITIDDYVPCSIGGDSPLFTSANSGEMWVPLLEKAVAKMFGSYAAIEGGYSFYALQILTGDAVQSAQVGDDVGTWFRGPTTVLPMSAAARWLKASALTTCLRSSGKPTRTSGLWALALMESMNRQQRAALTRAAGLWTATHTQ